MPALLSLLFIAGLYSNLPAQGVPGLRKVISIGCADCGGPAQFAEVADVAVSLNGTIWVADRDDPRLRAFSPAGSVIRSFGRRGEGPGEFSGIEKIFPAADGSIAVVDMRLFRLTRVDTAGRLLSSMSIKNFPFDAAAAPGSTSIHLLFSRFQPGTSFIRRADPALDSLLPVVGPITDFPSSQAPAEIHSLAVAPDGSVAIGNGDTEYRIRVFGAGRWRDITRNVPRKLRTREEMAEMQARMIGSQQRARAEGGQASSQIPREKPHFGWLGLRYDPRGRLWVNTGRGDESRTVFDLFGPDGGYLGEVVVQGRVGSFSLNGHYLVTSGEDQDGVPQVTLWEVTNL
jgi:hypothetical protein